MTRMISDKMMDVFTQFIKPMTGKRIVEIGTGFAHSAVFFSQLKPDWTIYTIDSFGLYGDGRVYTEWNHEEMKRINEIINGAGNVIQILGDSSRVPWELPIDVLYLDGNHTYQGVKADFERYASFLNPDGILIFDDYEQPGNETNGVKRFVETIINDFKILHVCSRFIVLQK